MMTDERVNRSESEKTNLGGTLCRLEEENIDLQRQVQNLQAQLAEVESQHAQRWEIAAAWYFEIYDSSYPVFNWLNIPDQMIDFRLKLSDVDWDHFDCFLSGRQIADFAD